jgi:hypothetical protein
MYSYLFFRQKLENMVSEVENLPGQLNAASVFVDENIQEGRGDNQ